MPVAECHYCHNNVPVKVSGDGKLRYLMVHPGQGKLRCTGSQATVDEKGNVS